MHDQLKNSGLIDYQISESYRNQIDQTKEDEIDFVDLVAVLWRRRWLMIGVVVVLVGLSVSYCMLTTPKYKISAQISPGVTGYDDKDMPVWDLSVNDIQAWIDQRSYMEGLTDFLSNKEPIPELRTSVHQNSRFVNIDFFYADPNLGKKIMQYLIELLSNQGAKNVKKIIAVNVEKIVNRIHVTKTSIEQIVIERQRLQADEKKTLQALFFNKARLGQDIHKIEAQLQNIDMSRIKINNSIDRKKNMAEELNTGIVTINKDREKAKETLTATIQQIDAVNKNTKELTELRQKMPRAESDKFALLMYSNIIQQNIGFANSLQQRVASLNKEINGYSVEQATKIREISDLQLDIKNLELQRDRELEIGQSNLEKELATKKAELEKIVSDAEIALEEIRIKKPRELDMKEEKFGENLKGFETKQKSLNVIEVVQPPFASTRPAKPAKLKIIVLGFCLALFVAVFSAFLVEFWAKNREKVKGKFPSKSEKGNNCFQT